jgi:hypothetical protein
VADDVDIVARAWKACQPELLPSCLLVPHFISHLHEVHNYTPALPLSPHLATHESYNIFLHITYSTNLDI